MADVFLGDTVRALRQRWYLVLLGVAMTVAGAYQATRVPPLYQATETLLVQAPPSAFAPNPLTGLYPSVAVTTVLVATSLRTPEIDQRLRAAGVTGTYEFAPRNTGTNQEPRYVNHSIFITNTTDDQRRALRAVDILTTAFRSQLKAYQDQWNVAPQLRITTSTLVPPSTTKLPHSTSRALVGATLLGGLATLVVPLWFDELVRRRRDREHQSSPTMPALAGQPLDEHLKPILLSPPAGKA